LDVSHTNSADSPKLHTHSSRSFVNVTGVARRNDERFKMIHSFYSMDEFASSQSKIAEEYQ
jgi:hypothetical protein